MIRQQILLLLLLLLTLPVFGQDPPVDSEIIPFQEYDPPSTLVVPTTEVHRARFPFVDVHNHQWRMPDQDLKALALEMDALNMAVMVNLSGRSFTRITKDDGSTGYQLGSSDFLRRALAHGKAEVPGRLLVFTNVDFENFGAPGWQEKALRELEDDIAAGASGLKIYKGLGFDVEDPQGNRVAVDDPRLDSIWAKCGELGVPVLIHTGEPAPFWMPKDGNNERLLELMQKPGRYRDPDTNPTWETLMEEQHNIFRRHPKTTFISAHLGWMGNDLGALGRLLDEMPNVYTEIGAVLAELGRQPRYARKWLTQYQDRVLFGKDTWTPEEYWVYFRTLETDDDYFPYYRRRHAFWRIYGLDLSDEVLKKIYYKNALRILPGIDPSLFPQD